MMSLNPGPASGVRNAPTLIRAKVNPEPDGMHREQRGDGRPAHGLRSACPCCGRPVSRSRAQQRVQPGQRGHNADRQFQAQQRGRKPAEPARDAAGHHRGVADGHPAHTHSATAAPVTPQRRTTSWVSGYPQALSPKTMDPIARFIASPLPAQRSPAGCHRSSLEHRAQGPADSDRAPPTTDRHTPEHGSQSREHHLRHPCGRLLQGAGQCRAMGKVDS